jgi:hypothetical protein
LPAAFVFRPLALTSSSSWAKNDCLPGQALVRRRAQRGSLGSRPGPCPKTSAGQAGCLDLSCPGKLSQPCAISASARAWQAGSPAGGSAASKAPASAASKAPAAPAAPAASLGAWAGRSLRRCAASTTPSLCDLERPAPAAMRDLHAAWASIFPACQRGAPMLFPAASGAALSMNGL